MPKAKIALPAIEEITITGIVTKTEVQLPGWTTLTYTCEDGPEPIICVQVLDQALPYPAMVGWAGVVIVTYSTKPGMMLTKTVFAEEHAVPDTYRVKAILTPTDD